MLLCQQLRIVIPELLYGVVVCLFISYLMLALFEGYYQTVQWCAGFSL